MLRVGKVSSINPEKCTARVTFEDRSGVVSRELPILVHGTKRSREYWMPEIDEPVLCAFLPNSYSAFLPNSYSAQGFILGSFYSSWGAPPASSEKRRTLAFDDGTTLEYDSSTHTLTIQAAGPININVTGDITVTGGDVIADGISLRHHTHGGVAAGSANTAEPS
jgi:phage baseplate assembly protein V